MELTAAAGQEAADMQEDAAAGHHAIGPVAGPVSGPFDVTEVPDEDASLLDLGSVRLPLPDAAQLQVEVDPSGSVRAVHVLTEIGQLTVSAYAAPRTEGLWDEVRAEIVAGLRGDGAAVDEVPGDWGRELHAETGQVTLRFVGVDGPRWLLRGVAAGQAPTHDRLVELLYDVLRGTVVVRGDEPMPVRSPLPLTLPGPMAEQLRQVTAAQQDPPDG